ncbi:MAG TPA: hypothetical protein VJV23_07415 [Candidatus Polarisedimenticolia bacterium]|nr:hypothetical protein [Candidatus Polarisedimenticolia bacterium]
MRPGLAVAALAAGALALGAGTGGAQAGPADERYRKLLHEKRVLLRANLLLKHEAELAAGKQPYIVFDVHKGELEFRVRGKPFKTYSVSGLALDERGTPIHPEALWRVLDKPITVLEKQGGRPELLPPDPESGRETGLLFSDPNQLASQTGATPVDTDAGLLGVDAPTDYYLKFEEDVVFHVLTPRSRSFRQKATDRLAEIAGAMRTTLTGWWGRSELPSEKRPRVVLYLTMDPDTAKHLHYSLLPGEKLVVKPPEPPPLSLVAAGPRPAPGAAAASKAAPSAR